jgi:hypothetical protein
MSGEATRLAMTGDLKMTFRVGQKVACIARTIHPLADAHPGLWVGKVYTVTGIVHEPTWTTPGLLLAEISPRGTYVAFESLMFRPIVERATDISVFTAMLTGSKIGANA